MLTAVQAAGFVVIGLMAGVSLVPAAVRAGLLAFARRARRQLEALDARRRDLERRTAEVEAVGKSVIADLERFEAARKRLIHAASTARHLTAEAEEAWEKAPAWESVARNLAAGIPDEGAAIFVRVCRAHGIDPRVPSEEAEEHARG